MSKDSVQVTIHDFHQPIQSALAWTDLCRLHISTGDAEGAMEALTRVSKSIAEIKHRAAPLIEAYVSMRMDG